MTRARSEPVQVMDANTASPGGESAGASGHPLTAAKALCPAEPARRHSPAASVLRGALALSSTQPLTWTASILATIFFPRYLGSRGLGELAAVTTTTGIIGMVVLLGLSTYLTRQIAMQPSRGNTDVAAALVLVISFGLLTAAALSVILPWLHFPAVHVVVLRIALVGMVINSALNVVLSLVIGREKHTRYAWLNAGSVVTVIGAGIIVLLAGADITAFIAASTIASGAYFLFVCYASGFRMQRAAFGLQRCRELARGGWPFLGLGVAMQVRNQIDVVLTATLVSQQAAGWLAAAYRIITIPIFIPTLVVTPLLPALSRAADRVEFRQVLRRSVSMVLLLTVPAAAGIMALAPSIPSLLRWPAEFHNSVPLIVILSCQQPVMAVDMVLGTALFALNNQHRWLRVAVVAAFFNPGLNLFMLPIFQGTLHNGAVGAALVEVMTELLMLVGALILLPRDMLSRETVGLCARTLLAGVLLFVVAAALRSWSLPLAAMAGGVTFVAAVMSLRVLRLEELRAVSSAARQTLRRRTAGANA